jgi:5-oxopent-3-ene-1,2,5-tricarboxylate decarboxylase/2-hydroxyhepta-2,4-diene-1,7-dioate isomerase
MIATGCPKGTSDVKAGDTVIIEVENVGRLVNFMVSEDEFFAAK